MRGLLDRLQANYSPGKAVFLVICGVIFLAAIIFIITQVIKLGGDTADTATSGLLNYLGSLI
jgi:hypothetical protein